MVVVPRDDSLKDLAQLPRWLGELEMVERLGDHTWAVRSADGGRGVARPIALSGGRGEAGGRPEPHELVRRAVSVIGPPDPTLVPVLGVGTHRGRLWLVSELDGGVDLGRFVELVKPAPAQALLLAGDVLRGLAHLHATQRLHTRLHFRNIQVGVDGVARLADWGVAETPDIRRWGELRRADLLDAAAVIAALAAAARCPASARSEQGKLLAALPGQIRARAEAVSLDEVMKGVDAAIGDDLRRDDVREELAFLVAAATHRAGRTPTAAGDRPHSVVRPTAPPAGDVAAPRVRRAARGLWGLVLAVAVLGLVVGLEVSFLRGPITRDLQTLRGGAPATTVPAVGAARESPAFIPAAGPIRALDVRPLQVCIGGQPCEVRVLVDVTPQRRPLPVAWTFELYDHCGASVVTRNGGAGSVAPGTSQLVTLTSVALPAWSWLDVVARTNAPEVASSAAMPVPAAGGRC